MVSVKPTVNTGLDLPGSYFIYEFGVVVFFFAYWPVSLLSIAQLSQYKSTLHLSLNLQES